MEDLWGSIAADTENLPPLSEEQIAEIERRLAEHEKNPQKSETLGGGSRAPLGALPVNRDIRIEPEAETELAGITSWYETHSPGLGDEFPRSFEALLGRLERNPEAYQKCTDRSDARRCGASRTT